MNQWWILRERFFGANNENFFAIKFCETTEWIAAKIFSSNQSLQIEQDTHSICNTYCDQFSPPKLHGLYGFPYVSFELTTPLNRCGTGLVVTLQIIFKPYEGKDFEADNIISIREEKYGTAAGPFPADCKFQIFTHNKTVINLLGTHSAAVRSRTNLNTLSFCWFLFDDDFRLSLPIDSILSSIILIWCTTCAINRNYETKVISKWTPAKREWRKIYE